MRCSKKPDILRPKTVLDSLFAVYDIAPYPADSAGPEKPRAGVPPHMSTEVFWNFRKNLFGIEDVNIETVELLKGVAEDWKDNLNGLELGYSIFDGVNFEAANFSETKLSGAKITEAYLEKAIFRNAEMRNTDFSHSFLQKADFDSAELNAAQFDNSNLANANFSNSQCESANFRGANLEEANFENANIKNANFENSNLIGVRGLGMSQIVTAYSFYSAKIDPDVLKMIESTYEFLLFPKEKRHMMTGLILQGKNLAQ